MMTKSVFFAAVASLFALAALFLSVGGIESTRSFSQTWQGYYTILVADSIPVSTVQKRLDAARIQTVSSETTTVEYNDFSGMVSIPVSKIGSRLDSLDPRFDPYMKGLEGYFHQGRWNIFYVDLHLPPPFSYLRMAKLLRGLPWRSGDFNWRAAVLCVVLLSLMVVVVLRRAHRVRLVTAALVAGSLPWISAALSGNFVGTMAAALVYLGWASVVELSFPLLRYYLDYRVVDRGRLRPIAGVASALVLAGGVMVSMEPRALTWILYSVGALICIGGSVLFLELRKHSKRQHRLFLPVRIQDGVHRKGQVAARVALVSWPILFLLVFPVLALRASHSDVEIPVPVVYPGVAGNTLADLRQVWEKKSALPSLADYVAHRAYQSGLPYGMRYELPLPGQEVVEAGFQRDGLRIVSKPSVVRVYSNGWFRTALAAGNGVAAMLQRQGGVVAPERRRIYQTGYPLTYLPVFWLLTFAVCVPAGLLRRREGLATVEDLSVSVAALPARSVVKPRILAEAPWRSSRGIPVGEEQRVLVSHSVGDLD